MDEHVANALRDAYRKDSRRAQAAMAEAQASLAEAGRMLERANEHQGRALACAKALVEGGALDERLMEMRAQILAAPADEPVPVGDLPDIDELLG